MEKSVEINENSRFFKDLELLKTTTREQMRITREEDGLGVLGFGGSNPLEQLGLFIKHEDEDEEETDTLVALPDLILAQMKKWRKVKSIDSVVVS
ncbi:hypothetical protein Bca52824_067894 [Brassica carinata]|uniref:Uncharacterized protein n=1 Tax=Brassica carinata TaxID=52824 RepID=A0A8X7QUB0_BRACI|nr:hypothetical protein Bca52824_067894 [Brassica carinata]